MIVKLENGQLWTWDDSPQDEFGQMWIPVCAWCKQGPVVGLLCGECNAAPAPDFRRRADSGSVHHDQAVDPTTPTPRTPMCVCGQQLGLTVEQEIRDRALTRAEAYAEPYATLDAPTIALHIADRFRAYIRDGQLPTTAARLSNKELVDLVRDRFAGVVTADGRTHRIGDINYLATKHPEPSTRET